MAADFGPHFLKDIDDLIGSGAYQGILLCTQYAPVRNELEARHPTIIFPGNVHDNSQRDPGDDWVDRLGTTSWTYEAEIRDAWTDAWLLSKCDFLLGGTSNMFTAALIMNPTTPFSILDALKESRGM